MTALLLLLCPVMARDNGPVVLQPGTARGCRAMLGADFACSASEGPDLDACQLKQQSSRAATICAQLPGCQVVVKGDNGWHTLKARLDFSLSPDRIRRECTELARSALQRAIDGDAVCHRPSSLRWRELSCVDSARADPIVDSAIPSRPSSLHDILPTRQDHADFVCAPDVQLLQPQHVSIHASANCIKPPPTEDKAACSLLRKDALRLCHGISGCDLLHCERNSDYCQVLFGQVNLSSTRPSFGDVDLLVRRQSWHGADGIKPARLCTKRHYHSIADTFGPTSAYFGPRPLILRCSRGKTKCSATPATADQLQNSSSRLQALLITSVQRFSTRSTAREPAELIHEPGEMILYQPMQSTLNVLPRGTSYLHMEFASDPGGEKAAYQHIYGKDMWLTDTQQVYERFFGPATAFGRSGRKGFFVEAGAVQGTVYDSNSIFYERFLGWQGLLVEANPFSFAKLTVRRPAAYRLETALCAEPGLVRFNLPDQQRTADGCCGRASNKGKYAIRCTRLGAVLDQIGVKHVDFWSLDVEGAELDVLRGFDWSHMSISVLLIEVYPRFKASYGRFLSERGLTRLSSFNSPTTLNEVWYNRSLIAPTF